MAFSLAKSILPMSVLRSDPERIRLRLKDSPVVITNKGTPDFGICDLETLEIAIQIRQLRDTLKNRQTHPSYESAEKVFARLDQKYDFTKNYVPRFLPNPA